MSTNEYDTLKADALRRAHLLRKEAMHAFWNALARRIAQLAHLAHRGA